MKKILLIALFLFIASITPVFAQQGCCSWHQGISHCDPVAGRYVCNDGTYSPTCGCYIEPEENYDHLETPGFFDYPDSSDLYEDDKSSSQTNTSTYNETTKASFFDNWWGALMLGSFVGGVYLGSRKEN